MSDPVHACAPRLGGAKSSVAELHTQVYIAERIGILNKEQSGPLLADLREISAMLQGLVKSLKKRPEPEP